MNNEIKKAAESYAELAAKIGGRASGATAARAQYEGQLASEDQNYTIVRDALVIGLLFELVDSVKKFVALAEVAAVEPPAKTSEGTVVAEVNTFFTPGGEEPEDWKEPTRNSSESLPSGTFGK